MKDNDLASISIQPMSSRHYEIVRKELGRRHLPKVVAQAVRAVFVDHVDPMVACSQFAITPTDLLAALMTYSKTWEIYCEENDLVTEVFWLPPDIVECAKAIEARELNRIQQRRKPAVAQPSLPSSADKRKLRTKSRKA